MTTEDQTFKFRAEVWIYTGPATWHFVSLPKALSARIKKRFGRVSRGWNSLPVDVRVGETEWRTSVFYDSKSEAYMLPLKASARRAANIKREQSISVSVTVLV